MYVKWTMAPSGNFIGVAFVNNRHYYSYGRTADHLEKNMRTQLYQAERFPTSSVHLEQERSQEIDLQYASKMFVSKYVKVKPNRQPIIVNKKLIATPETKEEPKTNSGYIHEIDKATNELVIYELKEVARYKLRKENTEE